MASGSYPEEGSSAAETAELPADATIFTAALNPATNSLAGLLTALTRLGIPRARVAVLTDADVTISPASDKCSVYILPAATLTTNRTLTINNASVPAGVVGPIVQIVRADLSAHAYEIQNSTPTGLQVTLASAGAPITYQFYFSGGIWNANTAWWSGA